MTANAASERLIDARVLLGGFLSIARLGMAFPPSDLAIVSALLGAGVFGADGPAGRRTAGRPDATVSKLKEATTNAYLAPPPGPF